MSIYEDVHTANIRHSSVLCRCVYVFMSQVWTTFFYKIKISINSGLSSTKAWFTLATLRHNETITIIFMSLIMFTLLCCKCRYVLHVHTTTITSFLRRDLYARSFLCRSWRCRYAASVNQVYVKCTSVMQRNPLYGGVPEDRFDSLLTITPDNILSSSFCWYLQGQVVQYMHHELFIDLYQLHTRSRFSLVPSGLSSSVSLSWYRLNLAPDVLSSCWKYLL